MQTQFVNLADIKINPKNPRTITEAKYDKLVNSILVLPKMLEIRPLALNRDRMVLGGNMRLRALRHISKMSSAQINMRLGKTSGYAQKTAEERQALRDYWAAWLRNPQVAVVDASTLTSAEQKEFIIKDNGDFGQWDWDMLANEWDSNDLCDWGVDVWQDEKGKAEKPNESQQSFKIEVVCKNESEQNELYISLKEKGYICKMR